jgi:hypothetical protein
MLELSGRRFLCSPHLLPELNRTNLFLNNNKNGHRAFQL